MRDWDDEGFTLAELLLIACVPVIITEGFITYREHLKERERRRDKWRRQVEKRLKRLERENEVDKDLDG